MPKKKTQLLRTEEYRKFDVLLVDLTPHLYSPSLWDIHTAMEMTVEPLGE